MKSISWPVSDSDGKRSTTATSKWIWSTAAASIDDDVKDSIEKCSNWRKTYQNEIRKLNLRAYSSTEELITLASTGMNTLYDKFVVSEGDADSSLSSFLETEIEIPVLTEIIEGEKPVDNSMMTKLVSLERIEEMVKNKHAEGDVLERVSDFYNDLDDESLPAMCENTCFVVLGATSELCPLIPLLKLGFTVAAISRAKKENQEKLKKIAKETGGRLLFPKLEKYETTGADVIQDFDAISQWLSSITPSKRLIIGNYIYLDGSKNVQACLAMDFIFRKVHKVREVGVAYLGSPGTPLPISVEAMKLSREAFDSRSYSDVFLSALFGPFKRNDIEVVEANGLDIPILNGVVNLQGPSYCLAKSLQVWRTILSAHEKIFTSFNICPPCSTESVFHVKSAARGLRGMKKRFAPLTYFNPEECRNLMGILLLSDVFYEAKLKETNVVDLLRSTAVHGGAWTSAYDISSISIAAYLYGIF